MAARKSIYPQDILDDAFRMASSAMWQEARGKRIDPHHLNNAEMSLMNAFYDPPDRKTAVERTAHPQFKGIQVPAVAQSYRYGVASGLEVLDSFTRGHASQRAQPA